MIVCHILGKVNYANDKGKRIGIIPIRSPSIAAFNANLSAAMENAALEIAMGGTAMRGFAREFYYCQLRCHDPAGDDYYVTFTTTPGSRPVPPEIALHNRLLIY